MTLRCRSSVVRHAQALAKRERAQVRERVVRHGHGKTASQERLRTELVSIEGLTTYESYVDQEQTRVTRTDAITKDSKSSPSSCAAGTIERRRPTARST